MPVCRGEEAIYRLARGTGPLRWSYRPKWWVLCARTRVATLTSGGQLRPHLYSRYTPWSKRFGAKGAIELIEHEYAHLSAFKSLFEEEGIAEKVCFKLGETFDAAMTDEAEERLRDNLEHMARDHPGHPIVESCRYVKDPKEAEEISQMKGAQAAFVHPSGQV